ncbi:MAG: hypothetical protein JWO30_3544 [Fibrobacteres bacterium]|nr:hypothetical protein [Fibrobacterota bacterium]
MAEKTSEASREENLDWNNLSAPVPMDLIDPEFPAHPPEAEPMPGARSEILPREESEALAKAHEATPETSPAAPEQPNPPTLEMAARGDASIENTVYGKAQWLEPGQTDSLEDDFSRIRAKMEAEAESEKKAKLENDKEEASQRERLEQWMANARARLLKADADLTGPSARIRIRRDSSPSLYRLAEMQKTIIVEGEATLAQSPNGTFTSEAKGKPAPPPLDPMATISVPADQFLSMDAPAQPTMREQALARQAAQQTTAQQASHQQDAARIAKEVQAALQAKVPQADQPYPSGEIRMDQIPPPMTREQALTRKVAQLRKVAEVSEEAAPRAVPHDLPERSALHFAIAAVVIIAIGVLGLGLFAATQAGLFDGLENRVPFLRPRMSAQSLPGPAAKPAKAVTAAPAPVRPSSAAPARPASNTAATRSPIAPATVQRPSAQAAVPANPLPPKPARQAVSARNPAAPGPEAAAQRRAAVQPRTVKPPTASPVEAPAYATSLPKASNLGEIILRASVQAATNIDADNLQEIYGRYALGFPGLSGEVVIGLNVDPSGKVLDGSVVSSTTGVEAFDQELLRKVLDWRLRAFPETRPKFITVPFLFPLQGR